jgi:predicted nuclease of restriction endonuclease-like (RecB) superfamily
MVKKKSKENRSIGSQSLLSPELYKRITDVLTVARSKAFHAVNFFMVDAYWNVGRMIAEEEQEGKERAEYGAKLLYCLSLRLSEEFGKGFDEREIRKIRQFYATFPIRDALRPELSWTHYRTLIRVENEAARTYYLKEAADQNWSTRALDRQINSLYYERLLLSRDKTSVVDEMQENTASLTPSPQDFIKNPYVLEFLGLHDRPGFRESDLEQAIIGKLQEFMLELGKGFAFVARQQRIRTETRDFFLDLVFYNYILKCFVIIDLKAGELTHQDIGQMDMYVRLYEEKIKNEGDNPTVGIILCTERDHTVVKYSVLNDSQQLFASKYRLYLPSEEDLRTEVERELDLVVRERNERYGVEPN